VVEKTRTKTEATRDELFEQLRVLRKQLADEQNVPAYVVFTDTTLEDMARQKPTTPDALRNVSGVGERKLQLFGRQFLEAITNHVRGRAEAGGKPKGSTQLLTLDLFNRGMSLDEIATERQLTTASIINHLVQLAKGGYDIDLETLLNELVTPTERAEIERGLTTVGVSDGRVKALFDHFAGKYNYAQLTLVAGVSG